jgi:hypothetical protein
MPCQERPGSRIAWGVLDVEVENVRVGTRITCQLTICHPTFLFRNCRQRLRFQAFDVWYATESLSDS